MTFLEVLATGSKVIWYNLFAQQPARSIASANTQGVQETLHSGITPHRLDLRDEPLTFWTPWLLANM